MHRRNLSRGLRLCTGLHWSEREGCKHVSSVSPAPTATSTSFFRVFRFIHTLCESLLNGNIVVSSHFRGLLASPLRYDECCFIVYYTRNVQFLLFTRPVSLIIASEACNEFICGKHGSAQACVCVWMYPSCSHVPFLLTHSLSRQYVICCRGEKQHGS